jgi:hypothetical protein
MLGTPRTENTKPNMKLINSGMAPLSSGIKPLVQPTILVFSVTEGGVTCCVQVKPKFISYAPLTEALMSKDPDVLL